MIRDCLRAGSSPSSPTVASVRACLVANGGVVSRTELRRVGIVGVSPSTVVAVVPSGGLPSRGVVAVVVVGKRMVPNLADARRKLHGHLARAAVGFGRGLAWISVPTSDDVKPAELAAARRRLAACTS